MLEEGQLSLPKDGRGRPPIPRQGRTDRELSDRRFSRLCEPEGTCPDRPPFDRRPRRHGILCDLRAAHDGAERTLRGTIERVFCRQRAKPVLIIAARVVAAVGPKHGRLSLAPSSISKADSAEAKIATENRLRIGPTSILRAALLSGAIELCPEYTGNAAFFFHEDGDPVWKDAAAGYVRAAKLDSKETVLSGSPQLRPTIVG